jgi:hypothetical protein
MRGAGIITSATLGIDEKYYSPFRGIRDIHPTVKIPQVTADRKATPIQRAKRCPAAGVAVSD